MTSTVKGNLLSPIRDAMRYAKTQCTEDHVADFAGEIGMWGMFWLAGKVAGFNYFWLFVCAYVFGAVVFRSFGFAVMALIPRRLKGHLFAPEQEKVKERALKPNWLVIAVLFALMLVAFILGAWGVSLQFQ
jgi:hypothetical protein